MLAGALNIQLLLGKSRQMFYIATEAKGNTVAVTTQYFEQTPSKKNLLNVINSHLLDSLCTQFMLH